VPTNTESSLASPGTSLENKSVANGEEASLEHGELSIKLRANGPLKVDGEFELIGAFGQGVSKGTETALCRCGGSANKPFCDGSHRNNGFEG
jgi:hypothetical protein